MSGSDAAPGLQPLRCDLFCTVIDNYGDLGVCWRLARQLAQEHRVAVTLLVDDLVSFAHLTPALDPARHEQILGDIRVRRWQPGDNADLAEHQPADIIIEGFGCRLPDSYLTAMAARSTPPCWLNLEYLSAESWVEGCHAMPSLHPRTGLMQYFFFPGFTPGTGGLIREAGLIARLDALATNTSAIDAFWQRIGAPEAVTSPRRLSLFSYENPAIAGLLDALAGDATPTLLLVFTGRALAGVSTWLGQPLSTGSTAQCGALRIRVLPLLDHADYDHLLALCDLNFVRGEDSFVRAQWAGAPMLWHIYPQDENTHLIKLAAWQQRVEMTAAATGSPMPACWSQALEAWNSPPEPANTELLPDWSQLLADLPAIRAALQAWRKSLLAQPDLATQLMRFYADRVESRPK